MASSLPVSNLPAKKLLASLAEDPSKGRRVILLAGIDAVDKKTLAKEFLVQLLGEKYKEAIHQEIHPDVRWLRPEGKSHLHLVPSMQVMLQEALLSPWEAPYRVYVIEEADRMLP
ncbi:MAG: hypothetical protein FJZ58_04515, partial [Chlamydiae bacterium]|nr:hypothetical protein [Chlamydiota bacterium]